MLRGCGMGITKSTQGLGKDSEGGGVVYKVSLPGTKGEMALEVDGMPCAKAQVWKSRAFQKEEDIYYYCSTGAWQECEEMRLGGRSESPGDWSPFIIQRKLHCRPRDGKYWGFPHPPPPKLQGEIYWELFSHQRRKPASA